MMTVSTTMTPIMMAATGIELYCHKTVPMRSLQAICCPWPVYIKRISYLKVFVKQQDNYIMKYRPKCIAYLYWVVKCSKPKAAWVTEVKIECGKNYIIIEFLLRHGHYHWLSSADSIVLHRDPASSWVVLHHQSIQEQEVALSDVCKCSALFYKELQLVCVCVAMLRNIGWR